MTRICAALAALFVAVVATPAFADTWVFTLQDVVFDDGATASGSFDYDTDSTMINLLDIVTTAGPSLHGTAYTDGQFAGYDSGSDEFWFARSPTNLFLDLNRQVSDATIADDPVFLLTGGSENRYVGCTTACSRAIVSGELVASAVPAPTPLPGALVLFAGGAGIIGACMRRGRSRLTGAA